MPNNSEELRAAAKQADMKPDQEHMDADSLRWKNAVLNSGGMTLFANKTDYQYKLPYTIQELGCLSRFHPMLHCCDKACCCDKTCGRCCKGQPKFMDMVDQNSGEQIGYQNRGAWPCGFCPIMKPHLVVWYNGQRQGYLKTPRLICKRCRACLKRISRHDVEYLGLYDDDDNRIGGTVQKGTGCCVKCHPDFPCKCMELTCFGIPSNIFVCVTFTVEAWPTEDSCNCNGCGILSELCFLFTDIPCPFLRPCGAGKVGLPWCLIPHGFFDCDPVCCECCIKGSKPEYRTSNFPLCCLYCPCAFCCISCPSCYCEKRNLPFKSTFRYETLEITSHGQQKGQVQFQYRGNYPSAYVHHQSTPFTSAMHIPDGGKLGLLATAVMMGRSYTFGSSGNLYREIPVTFSGPDFDGNCKLYDDNDVQQIMESLDDHNNVVKECMVGNYIQLRGYTLAKIGYHCRSGSCCFCYSWGSQVHRKPVDVAKKSDAVEVIKNGMEILGAKTWSLVFFMKDPEKPILPKSLQSDFVTDMQEVNCVCACVRFYKCCCNCTPNRTVCCRIPLLVKPREVGSEVQLEPKLEKGLPQRAPEQVVMHLGSYVSQKYAEPQIAWA